jgi:hypothetical protein
MGIQGNFLALCLLFPSWLFLENLIILIAYERFFRGAPDLHDEKKSLAMRAV